jgi:hypothetical protein
MKTLAIAVGLLMALTFTVTAQAQTTIEPTRIELLEFTTPPPELAFDPTSELGAVPSDFFEPGSEPFEGQVALIPVPTEPEGLIDYPGNTGLSTRPPLIPVEIVAMSLKSADPIQITVGGVPDSSFDVYVDISPGVAPGSLMLDYNLDGNGGFVVDSFFDVTYVIEFTPAGGPRTGDLVITDTMEGVMTDLLGGDVPWFEDFPGGSGGPVPGFVPGATELDLQPFLIDLGSGSMVLPVISVPEPLTLFVMTAGGLPIMLKRRRKS